MDTRLRIYPLDRLDIGIDGLYILDVWEGIAVMHLYITPKGSNERGRHIPRFLLFAQLYRIRYNICYVLLFGAISGIIALWR